MENVLTPIRAIRKKCLECGGGSYKEVRLCPVTECPLHFYRMGKNPLRATKGVEKGLKAATGIALFAENSLVERPVS